MSKTNKYAEYLKQKEAADKLLAEAQGEKLTELTEAFTNANRLVNEAKEINPTLKVDEIKEWKELIKTVQPLLTAPIYHSVKRSTKTAPKASASASGKPTTDADAKKILDFVADGRKSFSEIGKAHGWHHLAVKGFTIKRPVQFSVTKAGVSKK